MFQYPPPKRHPLHTFEFWFIVVLGVGLLGAWQLGMISAPQPQADQVANRPGFSADTETEWTEADSSEQPVLRSRPIEDLAPVTDQSLAETEPGTWPDFQADANTAPSQDVAQTEVPESFPTDLSMTQPRVIANEEPPLESTFPEATPMQINPAPPQDEPAGLSTFRFAQHEEEKEEPQDMRVRLVAATQQDTEFQSSEFNQPETQPLPQSESPEETTSSASIVAAESHFDFTEVDQLIENGDEITAHRTLSTWYWKNPEHRSELMNRLNMLAAKIYFHPQPHYMDSHIVQYGDRLESIAKQYNITWEYLAKLNRTDPQKIRADQSLKVIQGPFSAVVDLSDFEIVIHAHGYYVTSFSCGIGKDGTTPVGAFKVTDKLVDPTYYGPDGVIKCDDPTNPLGDYWIAIGDDTGQVQGYGIHGTIDPNSIGKAESRGCIRLNDHDIENVYDFLTVGSEVVIRH